MVIFALKLSKLFIEPIIEFNFSCGKIDKGTDSSSKLQINTLKKTLIITIIKEITLL